MENDAKPVFTLSQSRRDELFNHIYETAGGPAEYVNSVLSRIETCNCNNCVYCGTRDCPLNDAYHYADGGCPSENAALCSAHKEHKQ